MEVVKVHGDSCVSSSDPLCRTWPDKSGRQSREDLYTSTCAVTARETRCKPYRSYHTHVGQGHVDLILCTAWNTLPAETRKKLRRSVARIAVAKTLVARTSVAKTLVARTSVAKTLVARTSVARISELLEISWPGHGLIRHWLNSYC
nr:hypothetical protein BgiMline_001766 [Biomphalaria glabrata]